jgi:seryl-tRNA synthetase
MSDTNEQQSVTGSQPPVADQSDLAAQLDLLKAKNAELIGEKRKVSQTVEELQRQIQELQQSTQQQKQQKLAEAGEFQQLWKDATASVADRDKRIAELETQLQEREIAYQQQTIQARAVSAFQQAGVQQSEHMYALLKDKLRLKDGSVVALDGGVETDLGQFLNNLKSPESQFAYMFASSGARGMGAIGSTPSSSGGMANPYITGNFTEIVRLETENPELASRMKSQAAS